jgi:hypothetical protein
MFSFNQDQKRLLSKIKRLEFEEDFEGRSGRAEKRKDFI